MFVDYKYKKLRHCNGINLLQINVLDKNAQIRTLKRVKGNDVYWCI